MNRRRFLQAATAAASGWPGAAAADVPPSAANAATLQFPPGFVWGTSTSSYQIEGRGERRADSIWDVFCRRPGMIHDHSNAEIACDDYHHYPEDIALIAAAGLKAYRYSISWPRVLPDGGGTPDQRGLDFYDRVTDALLAAGIEPWVCLFHWDLPQALQDRGGWQNRDIAERFADYATLIGRRLGDRVTRWVMLNEAAVHAVMGHGLGEHAPGLYGVAPMAAAMHHLNLAQARGIAALRALGGTRFQLGTVMSLQPVRAAAGSDANIAAAQMWDALWNRAYLDPLFLGRYPAEIEPMATQYIRTGDLALIRQQIDFLGVNYYGPMYQRADPHGLVGTNWGAVPAGITKTAMTWPIEPAALLALLIDLRDRYGNPPIYLTENGASFDDVVGPDGRVDDPLRIDYLRQHIGVCHRALAERVDLRGYFVWTLMDNFEWTHGYTAHFGLVRVDRATLARVPKRSYQWFAEVARSNRL